METLGLSPSTPKSEGRLKSLLWPTITNEFDADYVTRQGFWLCIILGLLAGVFTILAGVVLYGLLDVLFFVLAGFGVRQRSLMAATLAFLVYTFSSLLLGLGVVRILMIGLLLSNIRGVNLANRFAARRLDAAQQEAAPERVGGGFLDNLVDIWPKFVWPVGRWLILPLGLLELGMIALALASAFIKPQ